MIVCIVSEKSIYLSIYIKCKVYIRISTEMIFKYVFHPILQHRKPGWH